EQGVCLPDLISQRLIERKRLVVGLLRRQELAGRGEIAAQDKERVCLPLLVTDLPKERCRLAAEFDGSVRLDAGGQYGDVQERIDLGRRLLCSARLRSANRGRLRRGIQTW